MGLKKRVSYFSAIARLSILSSCLAWKKYVQISRAYLSFMYVHIFPFFFLFLFLFFELQERISILFVVNIINYDKRYRLNFKDYDFFEFLLWLQRIFILRLFLNELFLLNSTFHFRSTKFLWLYFKVSDTVLVWYYRTLRVNLGFILINFFKYLISVGLIYLFNLIEFFQYKIHIKT